MTFCILFILRKKNEPLNQLIICSFVWGSVIVSWGSAALTLWNLHSYISSHLHYKNPKSDSWGFPDLTRALLSQGFSQGQSLHPSLAFLLNSSPCGVRTLEAVELRRFPSRNKNHTMGVFKARCGWCSSEEGQVTKLWMSEGCLWNWPWPSGCVLSEPLYHSPSSERGRSSWTSAGWWNLLKCYPIHGPPASSEELEKICAPVVD